MHLNETVQAIAESIESHIVAGDIECASDIVFSSFDFMFTNGWFDLANELLKTLNVEILPTELLRSCLTATASEADILPYRPAFYEAAFEKTSQKRGHNMADRLLGSLK